jgi:hypothetical protein
MRPLPSLASMFTTAPLGANEALLWSIKAMNDATDRVNRVSATDLPAGFAAIGESVWWITIVNDTLRRDHAVAYERAFSLTSPDPRDTLAGLRSVRNRVGHEADLAAFIEPVASRPDRGDGRVTAWAWRSVTPPRTGARSRGEQQRGEQNHVAYERALVGQNILQPFGLAMGFFGQVGRIVNGEIA